MHRLTSLARWLYRRNPSHAAHLGMMLLIYSGLACFICITLNLGLSANKARHEAYIYATIPVMLVAILVALTGYHLHVMGREYSREHTPQT